MKKRIKLVGDKGFTIVELLVVVAILAVLVAIVVVNVTSYVNKGKNAAIKGNLSTILTNGAAYFDSNGHYNNFCTSSLVTNPATEANRASGGTTICQCNTPNCAAIATGWCACSPMRVTSGEPNGSTFCVDSTGAKKISITPCGAKCSQATGAFCQ